MGHITVVGRIAVAARAGRLAGAERFVHDAVSISSNFQVLPAVELEV